MVMPNTFSLIDMKDVPYPFSFFFFFGIVEEENINSDLFFSLKMCEVYDISMKNCQKKKKENIWVGNSSFFLCDFQIRLLIEVNLPGVFWQNMQSDPHMVL